jgi:RNase P subunit RPR2
MMVVDEKLHAGYVVKRFDNRSRVRLCIPSGDKFCQHCNKNLKGLKCVRYEKGMNYLYWECIMCCNNRIILEAWEPEQKVLQ